MKKQLIILISLLISLIGSQSFAATTHLFVSDLKVIGSQNSSEIRGMLQTLLSSRLNSEKTVVVGSAAEADAILNGTYISIGKTFSIDTVTTDKSGKVIARTFVQGGTDDELIPAVGKLAEKISTELAKAQIAEQAPVATTKPAIQTTIIAPQNNDFIKPREQEIAAVSGWVSSRLNGEANLMALGATLQNGSRQIFLAEANKLGYYIQGSDMKLLDEVKFGTSEKIISLDTIDGQDGKIEIYVTIIRSGEPASEVWGVTGEKLIQIQKGLPYYFRTVSILGGAKKLYAQAMGRDDDFYGDVAEVTRNGSTINFKKSVKMPRYGNIYSFNQFSDKNGNVMTTVINDDGYLIVYDQALKELWRSNDKFGGSELYFQKDDDANIRVTGDKYRWIFMNQRIYITSKNELLVGKNDGFWVIGNSRSYKKGAVYCFAWNGSSLEEKWRTRETQNYMPDYYFDEPKNELLILQTAQRAGMSGNGASSISIKKVE